MMTLIFPIGPTSPVTDTSVTASVSEIAIMTVLTNATIIGTTTTVIPVSSGTRATTPTEARLDGLTKTSPGGSTRGKNRRVQKRNSKGERRGSAQNSQLALALPLF